MFAQNVHWCIVAQRNWWTGQTVKSPQDYLGGGLVVFLCQGGDNGLVQQDGLIRLFPCAVRRPQGAVGRHHQAPVPAVGQQLYLSQVGVALYLATKHQTELLGYQQVSERHSYVVSEKHIGDTGVWIGRLDPQCNCLATKYLDYTAGAVRM